MEPEHSTSLHTVDIHDDGLPAFPSSSSSSSSSTSSSSSSTSHTSNSASTLHSTPLSAANSLSSPSHSQATLLNSRGADTHDNDEDHQPTYIHSPSVAAPDPGGSHSKLSYPRKNSDIGLSGIRSGLASIEPQTWSLCANGFLQLSALLAWIGCCVAWSCELFHASSSNTGKISVYWDHFVESGNSFSFAQVGLDACQRSGKGLTACMVFAFLSLTAYIPLSIYRYLYAPISKLRNCLRGELSLLCFNYIWYLGGVAGFGNECASSVPGSVMFTGLGFLIFNLIFLFGAILTEIAIINRPSFQQWDLARSSASKGGEGLSEPSEFVPTSTPAHVPLPSAA